MLNKLNISDESIALAENGQQAVEFIKNGNNFDLVFMDVHMPVLVSYRLFTKTKFRSENSRPTPDPSRKLFIEQPPILIIYLKLSLSRRLLSISELLLTGFYY